MGTYNPTNPTKGAPKSWDQDSQPGRGPWARSLWIQRSVPPLQKPCDPYCNAWRRAEIFGREKTAPHIPYFDHATNLLNIC